ncbi:MAG: nucleoside-triphosphatase [Oscillospiraceae bacterium]
MHIFLNAAPGLGKSTVINRVLEAVDGARAGGFRSYFGADRASAKRQLYLSAANVPPEFDEKHAVARFYTYGTFSAIPGRFDALASELIGESCAHSSIVIMDECSYLESDALIWRREIMRALDGDVPILGVVRLFDRCWTHDIVHHPNVQMVKITQSNRDAIAVELQSHFRSLLCR